MAKDLTAADVAHYQVILNTAEGSQTHTIEAAYATSEPGWLLLKDHEHRTVAQFHHDRVVMVKRGDPVSAHGTSGSQIVITCTQHGVRDCACLSAPATGSALGPFGGYPGRAATRQ
jgi:hypothetical protein